MDRSPGRVVMGGDLYSKGCKFESRTVCNVLEKTKINEKESRVCPFLKKKEANNWHGLPALFKALSPTRLWICPNHRGLLESALLVISFATWISTVSCLWGHHLTMFMCKITHKHGQHGKIILNINFLLRHNDSPILINKT